MDQDIDPPWKASSQLRQKKRLPGKRAFEKKDENGDAMLLRALTGVAIVSVHANSNDRTTYDKSQIIGCHFVPPLPLWGRDRP